MKLNGKRACVWLTVSEGTHSIEVGKVLVAEASERKPGADWKWNPAIGPQSPPTLSDQLPPMRLHHSKQYHHLFKCRSLWGGISHSNHTEHALWLDILLQRIIQPFTHALSLLGRLRHTVENLVWRKSLTQRPWSHTSAPPETCAVLLSGNRILELPHDQTLPSHLRGSRLIY